MEELAKHGTSLPSNMQGLTDEQIGELKLVDTYGETCTPSGGYTMNPDPIERRNGKQPNEKMQEIISRVITESKAAISKVPTMKCILSLILLICYFNSIKFILFQFN
jgi:hypothetical protein